MQATLPFWRPIILDGSIPEFREITLDFYRHAVDPVCTQIAATVGERPTSNDHAEHHAWERRRTVQMEAHRSFALGIGAMWERNIRELLRQAAAILVKSIPADLKRDIAGNGFGGIESAFNAIRGFPLNWFDSYDDLRRLALLSSAIRHGDGSSAKQLQAECPDLFHDHGIESSWYAYFAFGGDGPAAVRKLDLTREHLTRFSDAVAGFWNQAEGLVAQGAAKEAERKAVKEDPRR
ncbi:MAG TPA: hypothetical protein VJM34_06950 [Novosphingobium sp.]|nr:hypothetical protein [Novosphingobium sp.]